MKSLIYTCTACLAAAWFPLTGAAQPIATTPVGYTEVLALGNSDTRFSAPLHRTAAFNGKVESITGIANDTIVASGTPGWQGAQFVYAAPEQRETYYVSFRSGAKAGMYYSVEANTANALQLDLAGDSLVGEGGVQAGDEFLLIPYWTLSTLFPNQQGITGSASPGGAGNATKVLFPSTTAPGVDVSAAELYFYYTGTGGGGPSWRRSGSGTTNMNDQVIYPDTPVIIRQQGVATSTLLAARGFTAEGERKYIVGTLAPATAQDNALSIDIPVPMTLAQSNLYQSGAFLGTSSLGGVGGDRLFIFDDAVAGYDKSPSAIYFYYTGTVSGGPNWRRSGSGSDNMNDEPVFQPGRGFVIRKAATGEAGTDIWNLTPPYQD